MSGKATIRKKVIILGTFSVGKTSITNRYCVNKFSEEYLPTIGVNIKNKIVELEKNNINLLVWDIADIVTFGSVPEAYFQGTNGILFIFDINRLDTYERIIEEREVINKKYPNIPSLLLANKVDMIPKDELEAIVNNNNIEADFFTSAKENNQVNEAFEALTTKMV